MCIQHWAQCVLKFYITHRPYLTALLYGVLWFICTLDILLTNLHLEIRFTLPEKILCMRGSLRIPWPDIVTVSTNPPTSSPKDIKMPGTHIPGIIKAGTFLTDRGKEFWYVTRKKSFLVLAVASRKYPYKRIILSVDNNEDLNSKIISRMQ